MKTWLEATKEDIIQEIAPGVESTDADMINKLNWTSWLAHIGELINMDSNKYELIVKEHFETVTQCIHGESRRAMTGEYPTTEESAKYMKNPDTIAMIQHLTNVTMRLDKESWPIFRDKICEDVGLDPDEFHFDFEML